jgi:pilus assembly protein CpaF
MLISQTHTSLKSTASLANSEQLVQYGTVTQEALHFLKACVEARLNIIISGGTGSGKTTLLNILSSFIPAVYSSTPNLSKPSSFS